MILWLHSEYGTIILVITVVRQVRSLLVPSSGALGTLGRVLISF